MRLVNAPCWAKNFADGLDRPFPPTRFSKEADFLNEAVNSEMPATVCRAVSWENLFAGCTGLAARQLLLARQKRARNQLAALPEHVSNYVPCAAARAPPRS